MKRGQFTPEIIYRCRNLNAVYGRCRNKQAPEEEEQTPKEAKAVPEEAKQAPKGTKQMPD